MLRTQPRTLERQPSPAVPEEGIEYKKQHQTEHYTAHQAAKSAGDQGRLRFPMQVKYSAHEPEPHCTGKKSGEAAYDHQQGAKTCRYGSPVHAHEDTSGEYPCRYQQEEDREEAYQDGGAHKDRSEGDADKSNAIEQQEHVHVVVLCRPGVGGRGLGRIRKLGTVVTQPGAIGTRSYAVGVWRLRQAPAGEKQESDQG